MKPRDETVPERLCTSLPIHGIDGHAHVFSQALPLSAERRYAPAYDATLERYLNMLDTHGLSHGVLVQPSFLGTDNGFLLACLDAAPQRLRGVAVIDPAMPWPDLGNWHRRGVVGVRENLIGKPLPDYRASAWQALLASMAAHDWHLEIQVEAARLSQAIEPLVPSGVRLVIDHFGRPDPVLGLDDPGFAALLRLGRQARHRRLWVKVSGAYRIAPHELEGDAGQARITARARQAFAALREAFGLDRLLWGSDWPHTQYETSQNPATVSAHLDALSADPLVRRHLLIDTAAELFQLR